MLQPDEEDGDSFFVGICSIKKTPELVFSPRPFLLFPALYAGSLAAYASEPLLMQSRHYTDTIYRRKNENRSKKEKKRAWSKRARRGKICSCGGGAAPGPKKEMGGEGVLEMERRVNSSKTPIVSELQPRSIRSMACFLQLMDVALSSWHGNDGVERAMLFFSLSLF